VLQLFPFAGFLAIATSIVALVMLCSLGDLRPRAGILLCAGVAAAGYCQFFAPSAVIALAGLAGQTVLAIYLVVRWRLTA
jgi:hypothetical protein